MGFGGGSEQAGAAKHPMASSKVLTDFKFGMGAPVSETALSLRATG
jgi:hypothetical protein